MSRSQQAMVLSREGSAAPLPKLQMFVAICVLTSEASCSSFLFPFVPFMVRSFGIEEQEVGFYSGW